MNRPKTTSFENERTSKGRRSVIVWILAVLTYSTFAGMEPHLINGVYIYPINEHSALLTTPFKGRCDHLTILKPTTNILKTASISGAFVTSPTQAFVVTTGIVYSVDLRLDTCQPIYTAADERLSYITNHGNQVLLRKHSRNQDRLSFFDLETKRAIWETEISMQPAATCSTGSEIYVLSQKTEPLSFFYELTCFETSKGTTVWSREIKLASAEVRNILAYGSYVHIADNYGIYFYRALDGRLVFKNSFGVFSGVQFLPLANRLYISRRTLAGDVLRGFAEDSVISMIDASHLEQVAVLTEKYDIALPWAKSSILLCSFGVEDSNPQIPSAVKSYDIVQRKTLWSRPGRYKAQYGNSIFCLNADSSAVNIIVYDVAADKETSLATYSLNELSTFP
jgi:hypothetical protein